MGACLTTCDKHSLSKIIVDKAISFGATLAGIASIQSVRRSPSHENSKNVRWPSPAKSIVVLALEHDINEPSLDWWDGNMGTAGNRKLISITRHLKKWLKIKHKIVANDVPYYIHKGGIFLKDAAVCAGLGVIGKNNLLITINHGPRIRLRALFVNSQLEPFTDFENFTPCTNCDAPCMPVCPQKAFETGSYERLLCQKQMEKDECESTLSSNTGSLYFPDSLIKYCRACELACPIGLKKNTTQ